MRSFKGVGHLQSQHQPTNLIRCAGRDDNTVAQQMEAAAIRCRQIEVVQRREHGDTEGSDQRQQVKLGPDVEVVGRFVQHQH